MEQCESGGAAPIDGLIGLRRKAEDFAEEWQRTREPGAEGDSARVAIESLRALTLRTVRGVLSRESRFVPPNPGTSSCGPVRQADREREGRSEGPTPLCRLRAISAARGIPIVPVNPVNKSPLRWDGQTCGRRKAWPKQK